MPIKRTPLAALRAAIAASGEVMPGGFGLSLSGRHRVTVSGCRRILRYGEEEIALRVGGEVLRIRPFALDAPAAPFAEGVVCPVPSVFLKAVVEGCLGKLARRKGRDCPVDVFPLFMGIEDLVRRVDRKPFGKVGGGFSACHIFLDDSTRFRKRGYPTVDVIGVRKRKALTLQVVQPLVAEVKLMDKEASVPKVAAHILCKRGAYSLQARPHALPTPWPSPPAPACD